MDKSLEFLTLVEETLAHRQRNVDYLPAALKAAVKIPEGITAHEAAAIFVRWVSRSSATQELEALSVAE